MPGALGSIGTFLTNNSGLLSKLGSVAGAGSSIYNSIGNAQKTADYNSTQSYIQSLIKDPTKMATAAQKFQQPLSAGLTDSVTNATQAQLAERGLGGSSAAMQSVLAQALAPYIQQNQQLSIQELMQSLGLGGSTKPMLAPTTDITKLLAQLKAGGSGGSSSPSSSSSDPYSTIWAAQDGSGDAGIPTETPDVAVGV